MRSCVLGLDDGRTGPGACEGRTDVDIDGRGQSVGPALGPTYARDWGKRLDSARGSSSCPPCHSMVVFLTSRRPSGAVGTALTATLAFALGWETPACGAGEPRFNAMRK